MGQYIQPGYCPPPNYHQGQVPFPPPSVKTTNVAPAKQLSVGKDATKISTNTKTSSPKSPTTTKKSKDTLAKESEAS